MKKMHLRIYALALVILLANACNNGFIYNDEENGGDLKSALIEKKSYIVILQDDDLTLEISKLKGYEKKNEAVKSASAKILKRTGVIDGEVGYVYGTAVKGFSVKIPPGQLKKLENDPSVKYVKEDQVITLIEPKAKPGDGDIQASATQEIPYGISRVSGGATYSGDKVVWVIDTGIDLDHEDLNVDGSRGWNFISNSLNADDDNGHGSHCAGTIAAVDNAVGVVGVAAGATVIPVKVLDRRGSGYTSGVIAGVDWVAANGSPGDVANMSLGGGAYDPLDEAVYNASENGIYFSLAAGNESDDANSHSPARVNGDYIYTISAMDINDNWAYFSNYGNPPVDYCEPGYSIYSTYKSGGYATMSGTSMAAPHMAGILVWGEPSTDETVNGDPDGNADPIGVVGGNTTPPSNQAPIADFSFTVNDLTVNFTDESTDDVGVDSWEWDFNGESTSNEQNPTFTFSGYGDKTVSLMISDGELSDTFTDVVTLTEEPVGGDITISATGSKQRGVRYIKVTWSGATGSEVDIKLNGTTQETTANDGIHTLDMGRTSGTFVVTVCETDGSACSNEVTVTI